MLPVPIFDFSIFDFCDYPLLSLLFSMLKKGMLETNRKS